MDEFKNEISKKYNLNFGLVSRNQPFDAHSRSTFRPKNSLPPVLKAKNLPPVSQEKAHEKLQNKLRKAGIKDELRPVPKGKPVFMLGLTKGKTRPLVTLYDTGCGTVLFLSRCSTKGVSTC